MMEITIRDNRFDLFPQKAVLWSDTSTLLISDAHLGKVTHFRKAGIALPTAAFENNFSRLDFLLRSTNAARIIFLGDLFHHRRNAEWDRFVHWRKQFSFVEMIIVPGNHDILPADLYHDSDLKIQPDLREGPFCFCHHPTEATEKNIFSFCGHLHPVYTLTSQARQSLRLPCFVEDRHQMILPSFGIFTGGYEIRDMPSRNIFVIAESNVFKVNT
jgi:DNA ligase-associated metallophosphoesterase